MAAVAAAVAAVAAVAAAVAAVAAVAAAVAAAVEALETSLTDPVPAPAAVEAPVAAEALVVVATSLTGVSMLAVKMTPIHRHRTLRLRSPSKLRERAQRLATELSLKFFQPIVQRSCVRIIDLMKKMLTNYYELSSESRSEQPPAIASIALWNCPPMQMWC